MSELQSLYTFIASLPLETDHHAFLRQVTAQLEATYPGSAFTFVAVRRDEGATDGATWQSIGKPIDLPLGNDAYIGLAVASEAFRQVGAATFSDWHLQQD